MSIPPTIQIETDIDLNLWDSFEFLTFNYKGDAQYYTNYQLRQLTSGILPVVVFPSVAPFDQNNLWTPFFFCKNGTGQMPAINPNVPFNNYDCPSNWSDLSKIINDYLKTFNYRGEMGGLLPLSNYIKNSVNDHPQKTVSLFCALYHMQTPDDYICKIPVSDDLNFYILNIQNGN